MEFSHQQIRWRQGEVSEGLQGDESLTLKEEANHIWKRLLWQSESLFHGQLNRAAGSAIDHRNRHIMEVMKVCCKTQDRMRRRYFELRLFRSHFDASVIRPRFNIPLRQYPPQP